MYPEIVCGVVIAGSMAYALLNAFDPDRKLKRQYGKAAVAKMSDDQKKSLAQYKGPPPPDMTDTAQAFVHGARFAPQSMEEMRSILGDVTLKAQLDRLVADPHNNPHVALGQAADALDGPALADGRRVSWAKRKLLPYRPAAGYWLALQANKASIEAVEARALPDARPALAFVSHASLQLSDETPEAPLLTYQDKARRVADLRRQYDEVQRMWHAANAGSAMAEQCRRMLDEINQEIGLLTIHE